MYLLNSAVISDTSTTKLYRLGERRYTLDRTYGTREWIYVQMKGGAIAVGEGVMQENGTDLFQVGKHAVTTPNARMVGVAAHAIAENSFGWVLKDGRGYCASDGTTTADTIQATAASGRFTDGTAVTSENGVWALETESPAGAGGLFLALIHF